MSETWRPVVGCEELYSVSDLGRVKRTAHAGGLRRDPDGVLTPRGTRKGYFRVALCGKGGMIPHG